MFQVELWIIKLNISTSILFWSVNTSSSIMTDSDFNFFKTKIRKLEPKEYYYLCRPYAYNLWFVNLMEYGSYSLVSIFPVHTSYIFWWHKFFKYCFAERIYSLSIAFARKKNNCNVLEKLNFFENNIIIMK